MSDFTLNIKHNFPSSTYEEVIKIVNFFENIYYKLNKKCRHSLKFHGYIGDVFCDCNSKEELLNEAYKNSNIKLHWIFYYIDNIILSYSNIVEGQINIKSDNKNDIAVLETLIKNEINNLEVKNITNNENIVDNKEKTNLTPKETILQKYWIPIISAGILAAATIIAAIIK